MRRSLKNIVLKFTILTFYIALTKCYNEGAKEECPMQFTIRGQQIEVTDALKDYVDKKLSRLDKYFDAPPPLKDMSH